MKNFSKVKLQRFSLFSFMGTIILTLSLNAYGQWKWIDANGVVKYSDAPPPASVPQDKILKKPVETAPAGNVKVDNPGASEDDAQKLKEQKEKDELDKRVKEQEQREKEEAEKQKKEQEKQLKENCNNAEKSVGDFQSGERIRQKNSKGEFEFLDDKAIEAKRKQAQDFINKNCR